MDINPTVIYNLCCNTSYQKVRKNNDSEEQAKSNFFALNLKCMRAFHLKDEK